MEKIEPRARQQGKTIERDRTLRNAVIEEAAKVAENEITNGEGYWSSHRSLIRRIASAIRTMKD